MDFTQGLIPEPIANTPVANPVVDALIWGSVLAALLAFPAVVRLWRLFLTGLKQQQSKLPSAERTIGERLLQVVAILMSSCLWGLLLYASALHMRHGAMAYSAAVGVTLTSAAALVAFLLQVAGYAIVGYTFATPAGITQWLRALSATQTMSAYFVLIPAIAAIIYPSSSIWLLAVGAFVFLAFRISLWVKSFQIFYTGPFSTFYFFLYLCTLECVPLLLPIAVALFLC